MVTGQTHEGFSSGAFCRLAGIVLMLVLTGIGGTVSAARPNDLFSATVPAEEVRGREPRSAFKAALARVLVKVTGRRDAAGDSQLIQQLGDPGALVQQYRSDSDGNVWVRFDETAIRRALDASGQSMWAGLRPTTLVWLALDMGGGQRDMLAAAPEDMAAAPLPGADKADRVSQTTDRVRDELLATADDRGLPLVLPLIDSEDLMNVSFADVWGDFTEPVAQASERYGADLLLIGRARVFGEESARVRWTLLTDAERIDWDGSVADGPDEVADFLAARLSTTVGSAGRMRMQVDGVESFDAYARVYRYLEGIGIVDACAVDEVLADQVIFTLQVRGDRARLMSSIALQRVLEAVDGGVRVEFDPAAAVRPPDLHYRLVAAP